MPLRIVAPKALRCNGTSGVATEAPTQRPDCRPTERPRLPQRHGDTERRQKGLSPVFRVNADSKRLSLPVNHLESTHTGMLVSVASKGLEDWLLRLKTGKTRCLSVIARSKELMSRNPMRDAKCASERGEISGAWAVKESEDPMDRLPEIVGVETKVRREDEARVRRGWGLTYTGENSMPVSIG